MAPKKKAGGGGGDGDAVDISCQQFMNAYKKKCAELGIEVNKQIKASYATDWEENETPIKKVSSKILNPAVSPLG